MNQAHYLEILYHRFFGNTLPEENITLLTFIKKANFLLPKQKTQLAYALLEQGQHLLLTDNFSAIPLFDAANKIDPSNPQIWYQKGLSFFEYGLKENRKKTLYKANKCFEMATNFDPSSFSYWWSWANLLFEISSQDKSYHYLSESKKKFKKAISLSSQEPKDTLAQLYWDYGLLWSGISTYSGEAIDVRMAIQTLRMSFAYQTNISEDFWFDFGYVHLQMALLINDNRIYLQATDYFNRCMQICPTHLNACFALAQCYTQLYINTLNDQYYHSAYANFEKSTAINPHDDEILLEWAQLLGESGKINQDTQKLQIAIEKCIKANDMNEHNYPIIGQWVESLALLGLYSNNLELINEAENKIISATDTISSSSELWYAFGICMSAYSQYYDDLDYEELAIENLQIGLSLDRTNAELWHALASSHSRLGLNLEDEDLLHKTCAFYKKALDLKPACPLLIFDYALTLFKLGELIEDEKIIESAIHQFEITLNTQDNAILQHPEWLFYYARALDLYGDSHEEGKKFYIKAIEVFQQVLLIDPHYPHVHYHIALAFSHLAELTEEMKYFHQSITFFRLAAKQNVEDDRIWLEWGLLLITLAQQTTNNIAIKQLYVEAEQKILKAGQLGNQHTYYHLACLYSLTNRLYESMELLQKAEELDILPTIEELVEDEWLENLNSLPGFSDFLSSLEIKQKTSEEI